MSQIGSRLEKYRISTSFQPNTVCKGSRIANFKTSKALQWVQSNESQNIIPETSNKHVSQFMTQKSMLGKSSNLTNQKRILLFTNTMER